MAVDKEVEEEEGGGRIEGGRRRRYPQKPKVAHVEGISEVYASCRGAPYL